VISVIGIATHPGARRRRAARAGGAAASLRRAAVQRPRCVAPALAATAVEAI
jgi:hypothetical protein